MTERLKVTACWWFGSATPAIPHFSTAGAAFAATEMTPADGCRYLCSQCRPPIHRVTKELHWPALKACVPVQSGTLTVGEISVEAERAAASPRAAMIANLCLKPAAIHLSCLP